MFTKHFWLATGERAIKTWAQTLASVIAAGAITWGIAEWKEALLASVIAAGLSVLFSVGSNGVGNPGPSLVNEDIPPEPRAEGSVPFMQPVVLRIPVPTPEPGEEPHNDDGI